MTCAPSEDSYQPGHPPSLIRVFAVRMKKRWELGYPVSAQRRLWSDWADAQADLSLRWTDMPHCWFWAAAHMSCVPIYSIRVTTANTAYKSFRISWAHEDLWNLPTFTVTCMRWNRNANDITFEQLEPMFVKHYAPNICFPKYDQICTVP